MKLRELLKRVILGGGGRLPSPQERDALGRAFAQVVKRRSENRDLFSDLEKKRDELRRIREESVSDRTLLERTIERLKKNGFRVELFEDVEDLLSAVKKEVEGERVVVKSKSTFSKEIGLARTLEECGIDVVETDIGDRIIQLSGTRPSHPTGPASHLDRGAIAEILSKRLGRRIPPEPEELIRILREDIVNAIASARIGITGANAITCEEGAVVIMHNEGNVTEVTRLEGKHIVLADTTKIYPDLKSVMDMLRLQCYYATGGMLTSYVNIIAGPSKTADIEKQLFTGIHGPKEVVVFLLSRAPEEGLEEASLCIGCGGCIVECPVYLEKGSLFGTGYRHGGIGVVHAGLKEGLARAVEDGLYWCTLCGACTTNCPVRIDTPGLIKRLRHRVMQDDELRRELSHLKLVGRTLTAGATLKVRSKRASTEIAYFPGCVAALTTPDIRENVTTILKTLYDEEPSIINGCCGGVWESLGLTSEYEKTFEEFTARLRKYGCRRIVMTCPHCYEILWIKKGERLKDAGIQEVLRLTELFGDVELSSPKEEGSRVAYHDSCIFGRRLGLYEEPRRILDSIYEGLLCELTQSREHSLCCGFPVSIEEPQVAEAMRRRIEESALKEDVRVVITSGCPGCFHALKGLKNIKVRDITEVLKEALIKVGKK